MAKMTPLRKAAKDECCKLQIFPDCIGWVDTETTVLAHLRSLENGMGLKAGPDWWGSHACAVCHDIIDGRAKPSDTISELELLKCQMRGLERTLASLIERDIIKIKGINL